MRGAVPGLRSRVPVASMLPGVYGDDEFMLRFVSAFDEALAPVFLTLDDLACYVDPWLAPRDFLGWLAGWVGVELDGAWTDARCRETVASAAATQRLRGTAAGVEGAVREATGGDVEVVDPGGTIGSTEPRTPFDDPRASAVLVRVVVDDPATVDRRYLADVVARAVPVHVPFTIEVVERP